MSLLYCYALSCVVMRFETNEVTNNKELTKEPVWL